MDGRFRAAPAPRLRMADSSLNSNPVREAPPALTRFRVAELLRGALALLAIGVGVLGAAELLLRILDVPELRVPDRKLTPAAEGSVLIQWDPELGWTSIPNLAIRIPTSANGTVSARHNSLGLREKELGDDAPNGTIIFL